MPERRFSNQTPEQILGHLRNFLHPENQYDLVVDPLGIHMFIRECLKSSRRKQRKILTEKEMRIQRDQQNMKPSDIRLSNTKKRVNPKIRSVKRGRTVKL
ncbi:Uncharacterised protein [uncultured archaeon]|nr:Uncharacterised protein [uncultured archaeon]